MGDITMIRARTGRSSPAQHARTGKSINYFSGLANYFSGLAGGRSSPEVCYSRRLTVSRFGQSTDGYGGTRMGSAPVACGACGTQEVIDRLAAVPTDPRFVLHEIPLLRLRALVARQGGDQTGYRDWVDRYRATATACGFQGTWQ